MCKAQIFAQVLPNQPRCARLLSGLNRGLNQGCYSATFSLNSLPAEKAGTVVAAILIALPV
jgi:hypothetical protein